MSDIHAVIRRLKSKDGIREQLPLFFDLASRVSYRFAAENCAMHACTLAGLYPEMRDSLRLQLPEFHSLLLDFSAFFKEFISGPENMQLQEALSLRKRNTLLMEQIQDLSDAYRLSEYIMNRVEHRFSGKGLPEGYSDQDFTDVLLRRIAGRQEEGQNLLLSLILPELPFRMTRTRFLDYVSARLTVYRGGEKEPFLTLLHSLRTAMGLLMPDSEMPLFRDLRDTLEELSSFSYRALKEEDFRTVSERLNRISDLLIHASESGNALQEVLNGLTALLYLRDYCDDSSEDACRVLAALAGAFPETGENTEALSYAETLLPRLEGWVEETQAEYAECSASALYFQSAFDLDAFRVKEASDAYFKAGKLLGNSLYADPEISAEEHEILENDEFESLSAALVSEISSKMADVPMPYYRAAAGGFLRVLPPFFTSQEALEEYIYGALSRCTDAAEKAGCIEIIGDITKDLRL